MSTQSILEEFDKEFKHSQFVDYAKIKSFLAKAIETAKEEEREKVRQEIIKYQNGFVQDDGAGEGNYLFAPEFEVIDNLLVKLKGE